MAVPPAHILAAPELLNDDLLGSELVDDFPNHLRPVEGRIADHRIATLAREQQDLGEDKFVSGPSVTAIDPDPIAFAHTKLMAAVLNNCVHPFRLLGARFSTIQLALDDHSPQAVPTDKDAAHSSSP
jgi:hypothetical protein